MTRSMSVLSPIQRTAPARSPGLLWRVFNPSSPATTTRTTRSAANHHPPKRIPSLKDIRHDDSVPTPEKFYPTRSRLAARDTQQPRDLPSSRDASLSRDLPSRPTEKRHNFVTPRKRDASGHKKDRKDGSVSGSKGTRTPLQTLKFGTPNTASTCSSRESSTASLLTPDSTHPRYKTRYYVSPTKSDGFIVPPAPANAKSRQRLKRL